MFKAGGWLSRSKNLSLKDDTLHLRSNKSVGCLPVPASCRELPGRHKQRDRSMKRIARFNHRDHFTETSTQESSDRASNPSSPHAVQTVPFDRPLNKRVNFAS